MKKRNKTKQEYYSFCLREITDYQSNGDAITQSTIFSIQADDFESACDLAFVYADKKVFVYNATLYDGNNNALWDYDCCRMQWESSC